MQTSSSQWTAVSGRQLTTIKRPALLHQTTSHHQLRRLLRRRQPALMPSSVASRRNQQSRCDGSIHAHVEHLLASRFSMQRLIRASVSCRNSSSTGRSSGQKSSSRRGERAARRICSAMDPAQAGGAHDYAGSWLQLLAALSGYWSQARHQRQCQERVDFVCCV